MRAAELLIFLAAILGAGCARKPVAATPAPPPYAGPLRNGDILFQRLPCGALCESILATTPCGDAFAFNHCGIFRVEEGKPTVVEAIGDRVQQTPLTTFLQRDTAAQLSVGRLEDAGVAAASSQASVRYLGRPYDDAFLPGDSALYCSELVWEAYRQPSGAPVFSLQPMTFRAAGKTDAGWVAYYKALDVPIPEGEPGINPCGIAGSGVVEVLRVERRAAAESVLP